MGSTLKSGNAEDLSQYALAVERDVKLDFDITGCARYKFSGYRNTLVTLHDSPLVCFRAQHMLFIAQNVFAGTCKKCCVYSKRRDQKIYLAIKCISFSMIIYFCKVQVPMFTKRISLTLSHTAVVASYVPINAHAVVDVVTSALLYLRVEPWHCNGPTLVTLGTLVTNSPYDSEPPASPILAPCKCLPKWTRCPSSVIFHPR